MSVPAIAFTAIEGAGLLALQVLFGTSALRSIGPITADVTVAEEHHDEMVITQHPVEYGAAITDHAFKVPARLRITAGWSNASQGGVFTTLVPTIGDPSYLANIYDDLLSIQASAQLLTIVTGKRVYQNMLIRELGVTTDERTENVLMVSVDCQEVIIVQTQTVQIAPASAQAMPQNTAATQNMGTQQPQLVSV